MPLKVVVLSHHSLLAGGIASKLSERPDIFEVYTIDVDSFDARNRLRAASPDIVVVDSIDKDVSEKLPIVQLLDVLPTAKVVRLDCNSDQVRIFSSELRRAHGTGELIAVMQDVGGMWEPIPHA